MYQGYRRKPRHPGRRVVQSIQCIRIRILVTPSRKMVVLCGVLLGFSADVLGRMG
jgi:hypothetical protein